MIRTFVARPTSTILAFVALVSAGCFVSAHKSGHDTGIVVATDGPVVAQPAPVIYVQEPPPPILVETIPVAPSVDFIWCEGHWHHSGAKYVWVPGRYERRRVGYAYASPRWARTDRGWGFYAGGWQEQPKASAPRTPSTRGERKDRAR